MTDPIKQTAISIAGDDHTALERRLKQDMFNAICKLKPTLADNVEFDTEVMSGAFFEKLKPALQAIAVAKLENSLFFYSKVDWHPALLTISPESVLDEFQLNNIKEKLTPDCIHDLSYVSYKHIEKMMGKIESASYWENLKEAQKQTH